MKKLAIILGMALLLTAGCSSSNDSNSTPSGWTASEVAELREGIDSEVGPRYGSKMTDCVTDYVTSRYTPEDLLDESSEGITEIGYDAGYDCAERGYTN